MDQTDISQQPSVGLNRPASGNYGEGAALDRLKGQLPQPGQGGGGAPGAPPPPISTQPVAPTPTDRGGRPKTAAALPPGVPSVLAGPTARPGVPVATPLASAPVNPVGAAVNPSQQRLVLLDALASSPEVSEEMREWAAHVLKALLAPR